MKSKVLAFMVTMVLLGSFLIVGPGGARADAPESISGGVLVDQDPAMTLVVPFYAGQNYWCGNITVWNDMDNIYVLYETTGGWTMSQTHLYVALEPPTASAPGQFPYKHESLSEGTTSDLYTVPFSDLAVPWVESYTIYIATHAVVHRTMGDSTQSETAWSTGHPFGKAWAEYFEFDPLFGTTLTISKTAYVVYENTVTYSWALDKYADVNSAELGVGGSLDVQYTIEATRTPVSSVTTIEVSGIINVSNTGHLATQGLLVYDEVQALVDGSWVSVGGTFQTITPTEQIAAGSYALFEYTSGAFAPVEGATAYRNVAEAMITNYYGYHGENAGKQTRVDCEVPSEPTLVEVNGEAELSDVFTTLPAPGFTVIGTTFAPMTINSGNLVSGVYTAYFTVMVTNYAANTLSIYYLNNTATLTSDDDLLTDDWSVTITTPFYHGYVYTIGYWKTHAGFGPQEDVVSQYLPLWLGTAGGSKSVQVTTAAKAVDLLKMSNGASNGIVKLQAQLLAAKLNIAAGASNTVSSTISSADSFLAIHGWQEWSGLSKANQKMVLGWMTMLDQYNNGLLGPMHGT